MPAEPTVGMDPAPLKAWLDHVAAPTASAAVLPISAAPAFDPAEEIAISGAVPRRRDEFRSGRECARLALAGLGCRPPIIPADGRRVPVWPRGFVGSISHGAGICVALVAHAEGSLGVGIDVEVPDAITPDLLETVASSEEWKRLTRAGDFDAAAATLCFSAKESVYKAYFPATRTDLDFLDLRVEVEWPEGAFVASLVSMAKPALRGTREWRGRFLVSDQALITVLQVARMPA